MSSALGAIEAALYQRLAGSALLDYMVRGVYRNLAPSDSACPFIVFNLVTGNDTYTLCRRIREQYTFQVKVIDEGYSGAIGAQAMDLVDELLTDQPLVVEGYETWLVRRAGAIPSFTEEDNGVVYQHVGAEFQVEVT